MTGRAPTLLALLALLAPAAALYSRSGPVVELTEDNFDHTVGQGEPFLVEFYAPWCGHCKALAPKYKAAAQELEGSGVRVGAVDCDVHKGLAQRFGVQGFPTIKYFKAEGIKKGLTYKGARDAHSMKEFALTRAGLAGGEPAGPGSVSGGPSKAVQTLDYKDVWTFLYSNPLPSVVLFGEPEASSAHPPDWFVGVATEYKETIEEMRERGGQTRRPLVRFAFVPEGDDRIGDRFKLGGERPAMLGALPVHSSANGGSGTWARFDGDLALRPISKLKGRVRAFVDDVLLAPDAMLAHGLPAFPEPKRPRRKATARVHVLTPDNADERCFALKDKSCVLTLLSGAGDDEAELAVARALSEQFKNDPLSFVSVAADDQPELAAALGGQAPAVMVVKTGRRPRYALAEAFALEEGAALVDKALGGDVRFTRVEAGAEVRMVEGWERVE